jgi:orotate phosphoribosyltransferase-like protein
VNLGKKLREARFDICVALYQNGFKQVEIAKLLKVSQHNARTLLVRGCRRANAARRKKGMPVPFPQFEYQWEKRENLFSGVVPLEAAQILEGLE